jgi:hypothetical protein
VIRVVAGMGLVAVATGVLAVAGEAAKTALEGAARELGGVAMVERKRTPSALLPSCTCLD